MWLGKKVALFVILVQVWTKPSAMIRDILKDDIQLAPLCYQIKKVGIPYGVYTLTCAILFSISLYVWYPPSFCFHNS